MRLDSLRLNKQYIHDIALRHMSRLFVGFIVCILAVLQQPVFADSLKSAAPRIRWSVVVHAGIDEEELAGHAEAAINSMFGLVLPDNVELLIETDMFSKDGLKRFIRRGSAPAVMIDLPEIDSADTGTFENFLDWAAANATGEHRLFVAATHSWGWKGIIQDYNVPGKKGEDTMMPLRDFSRVLRSSALKPDVLFFDSCVLGNAEPVEEMKGTAPYLVVSQRETPYGGFPLSALLPHLSDTKATPLGIAKIIPQLYAGAYSRGGMMSGPEGEYDVVTVAAIDMSRWSAFTSDFRLLAGLLAKRGFRERLQTNLSWTGLFNDIDSNVDVVELLTRLPHFMEGDIPVSILTAKMNNDIGYPADAAAQSAATMKIDPRNGGRFKLRIQGDNHLEEKNVVSAMTKRWEEANKDLGLPGGLKFLLEYDKRGSRIFVVKGKVNKTTLVRPWLPGVRAVQLLTRKSYLSRWKTSVTETREKDYVSVDSFPAGSFMISEAHTQGAPFIHGIGISLKPMMDDQEDRGIDPVTGLAGPAFYKSLMWNQQTHWGDLVLFR